MQVPDALYTTDRIYYSDKKGCSKMYELLWCENRTVIYVSFDARLSGETHENELSWGILNASINPINSF